MACKLNVTNVHLIELLGSFSNDDGKCNENDTISKNNRIARGLYVFVHFFAVLCKKLGNLSTDDELDDDDASYPRRTGPRVSFTAGKLKVKQTRPFGESTALPLTIVLVCLWRSKTFAICL